jgi:stringent starvation protein B
MQPLRFLEQQLLIDQRVNDLLRQAHARDHLGRERLPVHLLVVFLGVVERAVVLPEGDRLAVHARRVGAGVLVAAGARTAEARVEEDEPDDESSNHGEKRPFELLKVVAHQFEHGKKPLSCLIG